MVVEVAGEVVQLQEEHPGSPDGPLHEVPVLEVVEPLVGGEEALKGLGFVPTVVEGLQGRQAAIAKLLGAGEDLPKHRLGREVLAVDVEAGYFPRPFLVANEAAGSLEEAVEGACCHPAGI